MAAGECSRVSEIGILTIVMRIWEKLVLRYGSQPMIHRQLRRMGVRLGEGCRIYTQRFGSEPWLIRIGNRVCVSNDVTFVTHNLTWPLQDKYESLTSFAPIVLEDRCQIGVNVTLLPGVTVGAGSAVGAGSVVASDIPPGVVAAGNPARVLCTMAEYEEKLRASHIDIPTDRCAARAVLERHFWGDAE